MSANAIWYDNDGRFYVDGRLSLSPSELGRAIVRTLMNGESIISSFGVTAGYAVEMLRITGLTGRFYDSLADTEDHRFDYTRPTVGEVCDEGNPLAADFTVPTVSDEDPRYGADAIWWDRKTQTFNFGGYRVGASKLGRLLCNALMRGEHHVQVGDISVHVDDLVEMARSVGETGEFGVILD